MNLVLLAVWAVMNVQSAPATRPVPTSQPHEVVAIVLGQPIYADDVHLSERETRTVATAPAGQVQESVEHERNRLLLGRIGQLRDATVAREHLEATPEEIKDFHRRMEELQVENLRRLRSRLTRIEQELVHAGLTDRERSDLEKEQKLTQRFLATEEKLKSRSSRAATDSPAGNKAERWFITHWKFQKWLYDKYGGRVIWQQGGIEALDGMRKWTEDAEKRGDLKFLSPELRKQHFEYFNQDNHFDVKEPHPFDVPWWDQKRPPAEPIRFGNRKVPAEPLSTTSRAE
jgi:hypothetical protein